ncbi:MAG: (d)CMP kinase [Firmicutes bacterium]|nr:(d)CMP kinase [Bacillota bacterium]
MARRSRKSVLVIGAGAAGLMAAAEAARAGADVVLLEKNPRPGRKIGISGKGRCNLTNAEDIGEWQKQIVSNPRFLYSALNGLTNTEMMERIEAAGVPLKVERGNRVFPVSDKALDVVDALVRDLQQSGATLRTGVTVRRIIPLESGFRVESSDGEFRADAVILSTGGASYSRTGSTGDGYRMARELGHMVTELRPGLIPLECSEPWIPSLQGLSLRNVALTIADERGKKLYNGFGEMLFTHFGISGPLVLTASSLLQQAAMKRHLTLREAGWKASIDLKPALSREQLDARLLRDLEAYRYRMMDHALGDLLPERLILPVLRQAGIDPAHKAADLTREERQRLAETLKGLTVTISGTRPLEEAIVTMGGVSVREVDPKTMESRRIPGLYFAGEVLDVDALTGGFNLQIAFSTGAAAGRSAARTEALSDHKNISPKEKEDEQMFAIALDGPAGAGKSTVAKIVAARLGMHYVDTGAIYRTLAYGLLEAGVDVRSEEEVNAALPSIRVDIRYEDNVQKMFMNDREVTGLIRTPQIGDAASAIGVYGAVRQKLLDTQRSLAAAYEVIMDGRDIGTAILPNADVKIYLTADVRERGRRRFLELEEKNPGAQTLEEVIESIRERDYRDMNRAIAPLCQAEDAILVDTTHLTAEEAAGRIVEIALRKKAART